MRTRVRVNLANAQELLELPGISPVEVEAIVRFRSEHGPIGDAGQLVRILSGHPALDMLEERADLSPSTALLPRPREPSAARDGRHGRIPGWRSFAADRPFRRGDAQRVRGRERPERLEQALTRMLRRGRSCLGTGYNGASEPLEITTDV